MSKDLKGTKTEANLWAAFAGESQARNKYTYYASKAKKEGFEQALPVSANRPSFWSVSSDTVTKAPRLIRHRRRNGAFARAVRGARSNPPLSA
jgi:hypothetical protein